MKTKEIINRCIYYLLDMWLISFFGSGLIVTKLIKLDGIDLGIRVIGAGVWMFCALYSLNNTRLNSKSQTKHKGEKVSN